MRIVAHKIASVIGLRVPAAKGAIVRGMRAAEINLELPCQTCQKEWGTVSTSRKPSGSFHGWGKGRAQEPDHWL